MKVRGSKWSLFSFKHLSSSFELKSYANTSNLLLYNFALAFKMKVGRCTASLFNFNKKENESR